MNYLERAKYIISRFPYGTSNALHLVCLNLEEIPSELFELNDADLDCITTLNLSNNQLNSLPDQLVKLTNLEDLYLPDSGLNIIPDVIWKLPNLKSLILSNLGLNELSDDIMKLTNLEYLALSDNNIINLPKLNGSQLVNLTDIYLSANNLEYIPSFIYDIPNLKILSVSDNFIENISYDVLKLKKLQIIDIGYNKLNTESIALIRILKDKGIHVII